MQLATGICTYASPLLLKRCLNSLQGGLTDLIIIIHGRYRGFPFVMPHTESLVATMQIIEEYSNIEFVDTWKDYDNEPADSDLQTQMQHRNRYLDIARKEGIEWLLVMDDDEYIIRRRSASSQKIRNNLELLRREIDSKKDQERYFLYNVASVQTEDEYLPSMYTWQRPRMLYQPGHFHYLDSAHYHLVDPLGRIYKGHSGHKLIPELFVRHYQEENDMWRKPEYMIAKKKYELWQRSNETDY